ncbi:MAG: hypothetical protein JJ905_11945 [Psychroserpens sp.]|nr:hypothetical protein [Psychroserpens sp.]MBO6631548.1 hypothetical protein [Psychroserpens sp.]MBO6654298.1 hypothetical protein [Psychroserpens sp.]MBO6682416.1 hypothetical protein [Psychroserpens sp.]MBO6750924.1 hypothetical protein [Psychroserpens sp.]
MKHLLVSIVLIFSFTIGSAQDSKDAEVPYREVPKYADEFTSGTVAARLIDGLGFRFYWASEGLEEKDLQYKPNEEARSSLETIDHILDLSYMIVNSTLKKNNERVDKSGLSYEEKRKQTLMNLKTAADILRTSDDISQYKIIFGSNEIPFWNQINGPIADAIWHCGQLATLRRSSGNPISSKVSFFNGTVKD